jgi:hypothetical protein
MSIDIFNEAIQNVLSVGCPFVAQYWSVGSNFNRYLVCGALGSSALLTRLPVMMQLCRGWSAVHPAKCAVPGPLSLKSTAGELSLVHLISLLYIYILLTIKRCDE